MSLFMVYLHETGRAASPVKANQSYAKLLKTNKTVTQKASNVPERERLAASLRPLFVQSGTLV
jgi:hypothetical protein